MEAFELSKAQKKIARQIIETGLQLEFEAGIKKISVIIDDWKTKKIPNRDTYHKIYKTLINHDKGIGKRYDGMTGSKYLYIIAGQLSDGVISLEEINQFDDQTIAKLKLLSGFNDD